jgi:methylenetetrahydrofolate dehydrogenase (NADP+)/methenyltetrahydrofolate cyclohydrolase
MAKILSGKEASEAWLASLKSQISSLDAAPSLAVIRVGDDEASSIYVRNKEKACKNIGVEFHLFHFDARAKEREIIKKIKELNKDKSVSAMIAQQPMPPHISAFNVQEAISPLKDADGLTSQNAGLLAIGKPRICSATPAGIMKLLEHYSLGVSSKNCTIVGRSNLVGRPLAQLLLMQNGTITIAHSKTSDLAQATINADFLFVAAGKAKLIGADMVKRGAVVVDVGMNRCGALKCNKEGEEGEAKTTLGKLVGDVDFESVEKVASAITPVPGGVGLMTVASLMANTIKCSQLQNRG